MSVRSGSLEFSIRGDELEQNRIQLEHNLQHTDLSLHLSSTSDNSDVEYPRHNSGPGNFSGFASFDHISRDHFDPDESHHHAWSYRTGDDENGINPYEGRTISTAAHHASALTLSAGLAGRGARRDISMSGAEYDPDRPLTGIIPGFGTRIPGIDDSTRSRNFISATMDFDPVVVDNSAELDHVLQTGQATIPASGLRSPSSTSSSSRPNTPMSPRPKLSDALNYVSFSPKRPRRPQSPQIQVSTAAKPRAVSSRPKSSSMRTAPVATVDSDDEDKVPTPRSRNKGNVSFSYHQQSLSYAQPEVNVLPPTPPTAEPASKFTKMARGLAQEIEYEQNRETARRDIPVVAQSTVRGERKSTKNVKIPLRSVVSELHDRSVGSRTPHRSGKIYLPDVTGLTSVIASPMKLGVEYKAYAPREDREIDVRLVTTLNTVQSKLAHLEAENSVSRRRVRELELELEGCKRDVARERTRLLEREQIDAQATQEKANRASRKGARVFEESEEDVRRYKEAVEEKKALEALLTTLRSHLSRLTIELSDHSRLLQELRELRDSDVRALKEKSHDINQLRQEVERLGGEVEVLRGVVEEGLKERREVREQSVEHSRSFDRPHSPPMQQQDHLVVEDSDSGAESADSYETPSPKPSPRRSRTVRTDMATAGSPSLAAGPRPFLDPSEITRISEDISERRLERSVSAMNDPEPSQISFHQDKSRGYHTDSEGSEDEGHYSLRDARPKSRASNTSNQSVVHEAPRAPSPVQRPAAPIPSSSYSRVHPHRPKSQEIPPRHTTGPSKPPPSKAADAPFPQIRGEYLERLFFSAPDHNADTCTVCNRRSRARQGRRAASWTAEKLAKYTHGADAEDEGFAEESPKLGTKGKERERPAEDDRLPPQTVLVRVLRELEDDFTHYRGIYIELADQYKDIDPVSNVAKRNVLAEHLREVIDVLEQKGDQIASLYDLLTYSDKPVEEAVGPKDPTTTSSWVRSQGLRFHPTSR
ncbi:hypothetical protein PHLGIDRAFT_126688 [Phlebiopsis gigantea 11061_1 CR5-6]|uniref:Cep57 centrosome microtubule-binding domain-containing protein n=1 Tax=Phlebiopsis gigantea (strain 11061_1 CR5-6) TaxID=745531 RepID=A0A0C3S1I0_PHLG1|nr:hypothetical protein PHLGIDRAFT_126688 [Phlebiopsis gigantea 11061_1 CR5-6]